MLDSSCKITVKESELKSGIRTHPYADYQVNISTRRLQRATLGSNGAKRDDSLLQSQVDNETFVKQPPGFEHVEEDISELLGMKIKRSLNGFQQSPQLLNPTVDKALQQIRLYCSESDPCLYIYGSEEKYMVATLNVENLLLTGP